MFQERVSTCSRRFSSWSVTICPIEDVVGWLWKVLGSDVPDLHGSVAILGQYRAVAAESGKSMLMASLASLSWSM